MLDALKKLWDKQKPKPAPVAEDESAELPDKISPAILSLMTHQAPREVVLLTLTQRARPQATPEDYFLGVWPWVKIKSQLESNGLTQRLIMAFYRTHKHAGRFKMSRLGISEGWVVRLCSWTPDIPDLVPSDVFLRFEDPHCMLVDPPTQLLTPLGARMMKNTCLLTATRVLEYQYLNGTVFVRLQPATEYDVYDNIISVSKDTDSKI